MAVAYLTFALNVFTMSRLDGLACACWLVSLR
jgi:hypothetical protein